MPSRLVLAQLAGWVAYGIVHYLALLPAITVDERPVMMIVTTVRTLTGLIVSSIAAVAIARAARFSRHESLTGGAIAVAAGLAWMIVDRALLVGLVPVLRMSVPWNRFPRGPELEYFFVMAVWVLALLVARAWLRERELHETMIAHRMMSHEAKLAAIAGRLQPHFLFNSLNTARGLVAENPTAAREMLTRLAAFLRYAIDADGERATTLAREFDAIRSYLWIERARFEDMLHVDVDLPQELESFPVPALVLQPLVENAVRHATPGADGVVAVRVTARAVEGGVEIVMHNPGSLAEPLDAGTGLAIVRARLEQMYGTAQSLRLSDGTDGVVTLLRMGTEGDRRA